MKWPRISGDFRDDPLYTAWSLGGFFALGLYYTTFAPDVPHAVRVAAFAVAALISAGLYVLTRRRLRATGRRRRRPNERG